MRILGPVCVLEWMAWGARVFLGRAGSGGWMGVWWGLGIWGVGECQAGAEPFLGRWSGEWRAHQSRMHAVRRELEELGEPVVGQTVPHFGYLHPMRPAPPPESPWLQVDLGQSMRMDGVALIPAQVDWHPQARPSHGFPKRFRLDTSDDERFSTFSELGSYTEEDFPDPGIAPVWVRAEGRKGRYVRLTVTKLAEENGRYFYALGELMVLSGNRNVAVGVPVQASASSNFQPRWGLPYVVDGKSALGPPIRRELLPYDGLYSGPDPEGRGMPWMAVDLGRVVALEEVRLHPVHARLGADIPGFSFPAPLIVEVDREGDFVQAKDLVPVRAELGSPGNNPVTLRGGGVEARYVRVRCGGGAGGMR
ncbi:MAG: hypothetical protein RLZZ244_2279, partial [Verrucomicrobiota bacterium]